MIADPPQKHQYEKTAAAHSSPVASPESRQWGLDTLVTVLMAACGVSSGACAGLSLAAFGLALGGRTLLDLSAARIQVFLVAGPLLGLLPMAILCLVAASFPAFRYRIALALLLWLVTAGGAVVWFGLRPLLS